MTSLMQWVRRADVRRGVVGVAGATFVLAIAGCEDRSSNADAAKQPLAVTGNGVEIMEVVRNEDARTVEAVVVAGGEERQVTFSPLVDGPHPRAMTARLAPAGAGDAPIEMAFARDERGGTWIRYQDEDDSLELSRVVINGRVVEEYTFNGEFLRLQYSDQSEVVLEKATNKYLRGELLDASAELAEIGVQLQAFEAFAMQWPESFSSPNANGQLLISLIGDPVFATTVTGGGIHTPQALKEMTCGAFTMCVAIACRLSPMGPICGICAAGALACMFLNWFCEMWCGG